MFHVNVHHVFHAHGELLLNGLNDLYHEFLCDHAEYHALLLFHPHVYQLLVLHDHDELLTQNFSDDGFPFLLQSLNQYEFPIPPFRIL